MSHTPNPSSGTGVTVLNSIANTWQGSLTQSGRSVSIMADIENLLSGHSTNTDKDVASIVEAVELDHLIPCTGDLTRSPSNPQKNYKHCKLSEHPSFSQISSPSPSYSISPTLSLSPTLTLSRSSFSSINSSPSPSSSHPLPQTCPPHQSQRQTHLQAEDRHKPKNSRTSNPHESLVHRGAMKSRAEIRRARAARNRNSARRSRLRKKAETERDKENAESVAKMNAELKEEVHHLHEEMVALQKVADELGLSKYGQGESQ